MSKDKRTDHLTDLIGEIDEKYILEAKLPEETLKQKKEQRGTTPVVVNSKAKAEKDATIPFAAGTAPEELEIERAVRPTKNRKVFSIVRVATGISLMAAAALLFIFLWKPTRGGNPGASTEVAFNQTTADVTRSTEGSSDHETSALIESEKSTETELALIDPNETIAVDPTAEITDVWTTKAGLTFVPSEPEPDTEAPTQAPVVEPTQKPTEGTSEPAERNNKVIRFGFFDQDNDPSNMEPIEWYVLDQKDGKMLIVSKDILDFRAYDDGTHTTWADSTLRAWLNSEFLNTAFSAEEKAKIFDTTNKTIGSIVEDTVGSSTSTEKVFILSKEDVLQYYVETPHCTIYALEAPELRGDYMPWIVDAEDQNWYNCWARTNGGSEAGIARGYNAAAIDNSGDEIFSKTTTKLAGVRPAMWIDASAIAD
ncbi:MAG: hypothetical protein IKX10_00865 [Lachnospiraceae bacterium]|nr:hypothetical protein [Lachnospiraceae bacterium]